MSLSTPTQVTIPFADTGTRTAIPQAADNATGRAGYDLGFPPINLTPKIAGGIPPFGQDMNGILYDITVAEQFVQAGGSWPYDSTFAAAIGGYPLGALVQRSDSSGFWRNVLSGNTTDPDAGGANWVPEDSGVTSVAMSNANVTLTSLQAAKPIIIITGTLTANLNLIFPDYAKTWTIVNTTSGNFTITCKTLAGVGVSVVNGLISTIVGDGSTGIYFVQVSAATQAQQEAASSTTVFVTPGRQQFHPSAAKAWGNADFTGNIAASYNLSSVTDVGAGQQRYNFSTPFSNANYCSIAVAEQTPGGTAATTPLTIPGVGADKTASAHLVRTLALSTYSVTDSASTNYVAYGDQ